MHHMVHWFLSVIATLLAFGMLSILTLAQAPSVVDLTLGSQAEYVLVGQPFTYTLTLTNNGSAPLKDIILFIDTPAQTTLARTGQPVDWYTAAPPVETGGRIGWTTQTPIEPGSTVSFTLVINVPSDMANRQLVCQTYGLVPLGAGDMLASGPPITTQIVAVLPTATVSPLPTITPLPTATLIPPATTPTPTATPLPPTAVPTTTAAVSMGSSGAGIMISLIIVTGLTAGLVWFLTKRR